MNGEWEIDEIINKYSKHTIMHESVTTHNEEIFDFLVGQKAHLMVRDANGYTPMLKAASLGFTSMVKTLVENGVDPRHTDFYGNSPLDKSKLFENHETTKYLQDVIEEIEKQEKDIQEGKEVERQYEFKNWAEEPLHHRGRFRTWLDYKA